MVKSRCFTDNRVVGNIEQTIEAYNRRNVDEIIVLDTGASKRNSSIDFDQIENITGRSLMPVSYGGGISSVSDISKCLALGCDKVIINYHGLNNFEFIKNAMRKFGVQAITVSIDIISAGNGDLYIYFGSGGEAFIKITNIFFLIKQNTQT